ncbi:MAG: hypothetical protein A3H98_00235 [Bacteroidetes bacterium RIFCSPLOWO2_02_FULL_36_8]|nr:MAG: hypothetical protein A3H98_00235 [Bacteroidetes bacterium RIFCSPLOWO2_02_FULL_36_8]OFY70838.1 MAG: hypothetical protein A3G23_12000 [Bacteroidetes bacterium RIFCSPLOWO2_12_FULL_37_12]
MINKLSYISTLTLGIFFTFLSGTQTYGQQYIVPENIDFAGIQLVPSTQLKQEIASNVNAIYANQKFFEEIIEKTDLYFPVINKIFAQTGIHKDLCYIAILESGLVNEPSKPSEDEAGIWKLKSLIAKEASLIINDQMDERMHLGQSTKAVCGILLKSNSIFNNWIYSMLAYHVGQETAITLADYKFYSARKMSLDSKTHWFIIKAISYKLAFENYLEKNPNPSLLFFEYEGAPEQTLSEIADANQIGTADVKDFNPWFFGIKLPPDNKKYTVFIPLHAEMGVKQGLPRELYSNMPPPIFLMKNGLRAVQAKFGDTYERLAQATGITVELIKEYNEIGPFNQLAHGQVCYVEKKNKKPSKETPPFHIVKYGETIWSISQHYGMFSSLIRDFNWLYPGDELKPAEEPKIGQKLWLQQKRPKETGVEIVLDIQEPEFSETALANSEKMGEPDGWEAYDEDTKPEKSENNPVPNNLKPEPVEVLLSNKNTETSSSSSEDSGMSRNSNSGIRESLSAPVSAPVNAFAPEPQKEKALPNPEPKDKEPAPPVNLSKEQNTSVVSAPVTTSEETKNSNTKLSGGEPGVLYHTVLPNQNLFRVSLQYNVSIQKIKEWNNLSSNSVSVGQVIKIYKDDKAFVVANEISEAKTITNGSRTSSEPVAKEEQTRKNLPAQPSSKPSTSKEKQTEKTVAVSSKNEPAQATVTTSKNQEEKNKPEVSDSKPEVLTSSIPEVKPVREGNKSFHIVSDKETIFGIANKYKMSVNDLMQMNGFDTYDIKTGQKLAIKDNASAEDNFQLHTVSSGETLVAIAMKYGYKVSEILTWNGRSTLDVNAGEKLKIKK